MASLETNLRVNSDESLKKAAQDLMDAAMNYWKEYSRVTGGAAVVWVKDDDGRMVVLTRGEYRHTIMQNIDRINNQDNVLSFD